MECQTDDQNFGAYKDVLVNSLSPLGFELYPLKVGWYNQVVEDVFRLPYDDESFGLLLVSTPQMFELSFIPYIKQYGWDSSRDPLDQSVQHRISKAISELPSNVETVVLHDYDLDARRRPKILVQTVGHISGAAYFYQKSYVTQKSPWTEQQRICGVSLHPKYGGWFAFRGVVIFPNVHATSLQQINPEDLLKDEAKAIDLMERFNYHWQDGTFRDAVETKAKYSQLQQEYFLTLPKERSQLVDKILSSA